MIEMIPQLKVIYWRSDKSEYFPPFIRLSPAGSPPINNTSLRHIGPDSKPSNINREDISDIYSSAMTDHFLLLLGFNPSWVMSNLINKTKKYWEHRNICNYVIFIYEPDVEISRLEFWLCEDWGWMYIRTRPHLFIHMLMPGLSSARVLYCTLTSELYSSLGMLVTTVQICGEYSWWSWGSCLPPETAADEWMAFFLARTGSGRQDEWHDEIFYYTHRTVPEEAVKHQTFTRETYSNPIT